jgi:hypothetical protein
MTIREKIEKALSENKRVTAEDPQKLGEFIEELRREGLLTKKQYDLPPLDTVGRQLYQENASDSALKT